jgi:hypothetical protein
MNLWAAQFHPGLGGLASAIARQPFLRATTVMGAVKRGIRPGMTAAMILEEGCFYAEQKWHWTGLTAAGAILSEGLWAYQIDKERRDREQGLRV